MDFKEWRRELLPYRAPRDFDEKLKTFRREHGDHLLSSSGTQFFRDAENARDFAFMVGASKVRLVEHEPPDFEIKFFGETQGFEVTEADCPGRRRGDEINTRRKAKAAGAVAEGQPFFSPVPEGPDLTPELAEQVLRKAAKGKDDTRSDLRWQLLIRFNLWDLYGDADRQVIEDLMTDATAAAKDRFAAVWVMWNDKAGSMARNTWLNGEPGTRIIHRQDIRPSP